VSLRRLSTGLIVGSQALLFSACGDPTGIGREPDALSLRVEAAGPLADALLYCPVKHSRSRTDVIDARGGSLQLEGHSIDIPAGAVSAPTAFTISVPASLHLEVDVSAAGNVHYRFAKPVVMTISYKRCARQDPASLTVWYIDQATGSPIEPMPGVDDKRRRSITFLTDHLSGYAIAD
jgi:hypothetical protein